MNTFLGRAHAMCVRGDRVLRVVGHVNNKWYHDIVLDFVNSNQFKPCTITEDTPDRLTVVLYEERRRVL